MAALDTTSADAALKQVYKGKNFQLSVYDRRPIIGLLPKDETFFGRNMPLVNYYGNPASASASFSNAQANTTAASMEDYLLTRINMHSVAHIDGEALDAMSNNSGAFLTAMKVQVDGARRALADRLESLAPRSQTGALGQISSGSNVSTDTITLANTNDHVNFEVGMEIVASTADGGALRNSGASTTLQKVNRRDGKLTTDEAAWDTTITAIATTDYLYVEGDAQNNGTAAVTAGLQSWLPATAPSSGESFFGVDRSVDTRLYGNYYDGSSDLIENALIIGASLAANEGGKPDCALLSHVKYRVLSQELGSKAEYTVNASGAGGKRVADVGYDAIKVHGDAGVIDVVAANKCPSDKAFILEKETWAYGSIGPLVKFNLVGGRMLRDRESADGVETRLVHRGNIGCVTPSFNTHVAL